LSKKIDISEFDQFIQGSLEGAKVPAPTGVWEGVSAASSMASSASQIGILAKIGGIKTLVIGVSVALVATVATVVMTQEDDKATIAQTEQANESTTVVNEESDYSTASSAKEDINQIEAPISSKNNSANEDGIIANEENGSNNESGNVVINGEDFAPEQDNGKDGQDEKTEMAPLDFELSSSEICRSESCKVSIKSNKNNIDFYWMVDGIKHFNKQSIEIKPANAGNIKVSLISFPNGVKQSISKSIYVHESKAKIETVKIQRGLYSFKTSSEYMSYKWLFGPEQTVSNIAQPTQYFDYQTVAASKVILWTVNKRGCKDSVHANVSLVEAPKITNTFTPYEQDGMNDRFIIPIEHEKLYKLLVFNAIGEVVFESSSKNNTWDGRDMTSGKMLPPGAYNYKFVYQQIGAKKMTKQGTIHLLK
jgi:gliding motility-associated-like protein